jgi:hypothetical protein
MDVKVPKKVKNRLIKRVDIIPIPEKKRPIVNYEQRKFLRSLRNI